MTCAYPLVGKPPSCLYMQLLIVSRSRAPNMRPPLPRPTPNSDLYLEAGVEFALEDDLVVKSRLGKGDPQQG
jgi:hypothetical protein